MTQRVVNYTYGTGNPVLPDGSIDVRDGIDNLQSMDVFMNAPEDTYNQRDGNVVRTVAGMNNEFDAKILSMGFTRIGTFAAGATLTNPRQTLLWDIADGGDGQEYGWSGAFPKVVPAASTPASTGGISVGAWISRFDPELRIQVREALRRSYAEAGYNLVNGSFEVGGTLVNANDVLLHEASGKAFSGAGGVVAAGTNPVSGGFTDKSGELLRGQIFRNVNLRQIFLSDHCVMDGSSDDSAGFIAALDAAYALFDSNPSAGKVTIVNDGLVILGSNISVNVTKVGFKGGAINTRTGSVYANNRLFDFNNGTTPVLLSSYNNRQVPIFDGMILTNVTGTSLGCFYLEKTSGDPNSSVCLQNFWRTTFHGFGKIFTHGTSGWGTEWYSCSARACASWMDLVVAADTYERHSFFGCIWHNSQGAAFTCSNINGRIYWYGGSCDYSSKLANMSAGLLTFEGHIEYKNRTGPLITLTGGGQVKLGGLLAVLGDTSSYFLVEQASDFQLVCDDLFIITDAAPVLGRLTNKRYAGSLTANTPGAETFISNPLNISTDMRVPIVTTGVAGVSVSQTSVKIEITSSAPGGAAKSARIVMPIPESAKKIGWDIAYNNSSPATLFIEKYFESGNGLISTTIPAGGSTFNPSATGNLRSVVMQSVPAWADKIVFVCNLANLGTTGSLSLSSLGLFEQ